MADLKLRLIFDVDYDTNGADADELRRMLTYTATHAMNEGLLTDDTPAEVASHRIEWEERPAIPPCGDPMLGRILNAPSFTDPGLGHEHQWNELANLMWERLDEEKRHAVYFAFMGKQYDSEE